MIKFIVLFTLLSITHLTLGSPAVKTAQVDLGYEIHQGWLNTTGGFYNFSNIPYAAPPIGNLRFSAPVPPKGRSRAINDGSRFAVCPNARPAWTSTALLWLTKGLGAINVTAGYQIPTITTLPPVLPGTSEDCLLLDVLVPKKVYEKRLFGEGAPVMVWIHGGGYDLGWKTQYGSGVGLLKASQKNGGDGVIYVALNYRLGLFGFLSGPTFQIDGTPNAGLLDQRMALEWIQKNIHKFGGDPNKVTVIGESAGGGSVIHQITAYGGLKGPVPFQQAIIQSGAFLPVPTNIRQENIFQKFLSVAGVTNLKEARRLSTEKLQLVNAILVGEAPYSDYTFNPVVDGSFAPALPGELLLHGQFDKSLKIMSGHNADEGLYFTSPFITDEETFKKNVILPSFPDADSSGAANYIQNTLYPPVFDGSNGYTNQIARADRAVSESIFSCNANYLARAFGTNAYRYFFDVTPALHGDDVPYTFYEGPAASVKNNTLALAKQSYFTNFAKSGNPNGEGLPAFPNYGGGKMLDLGLSKITPVPDNLAMARCYWWQKALYF